MKKYGYWIALLGFIPAPEPERTVQLRDMHLYDVKWVLTLDTARTYTLRGWDNDMQRPFVMQGDSVVYY